MALPDQHEDLLKRLEAREWDTSSDFDSSGGLALINPDGPEAAKLIRSYAERVERLEDSVEGLTEDLYQAVLVAYRRGAVEWTRLNYPKWFEDIERGQEVAPVQRAALTPEQETEG